MRINRFLSQCGITSRRGADELIALRRVVIVRDGFSRTAVPGDDVGEEDTVLLDGKTIRMPSAFLYYLYHKPAGITSTASLRDPCSLANNTGLPPRLGYAGRLDKDSSGLMLMTNDGDLIRALTLPERQHEKEYAVTLDRDIDAAFLRNMREGVEIGGRKTMPCVVRKTGRRSAVVILHQGMNRQIRRMCGKLGYGVTSLKRVRIGSLLLGDLQEGETRPLTKREIASLREECGLPVFNMEGEKR